MCRLVGYRPVEIGAGEAASPKSKELYSYMAFQKKHKLAREDEDKWRTAGQLKKDRRTSERG